MNFSQPVHTRQADSIVIGAGTLGTFHAYFAARKGYKTLLLERNDWPADASTRNFGMVVRSIVETGGQWATFAHASAQIYRELQQAHDISLRESGSLYLASTECERRVLAEFAELFASDYHCDYLDADEARQRYPFIQPAYCRGALHFRDDLTVEPRLMLRQLIPYLTQHYPLEYIPQTTVVAIEADRSGCHVKDARGNVFTAKHVFVCSGAEYRTLFPDLFAHSGLQICKLQMMGTVPLPERTLPHSILSGLSIERYPAFKACPSYHLLREQAREEDLSRYGIHLLFKQGADGSVIIGDSHEYSPLQAGNEREDYTSPAITQAILRYGQRMIALPSWEIQQMWNGYYLLHPQREVYTETIDRVIHVATGIAGKGMSTGPGFAQWHIDSILG